MDDNLEVTYALVKCFCLNLIIVLSLSLVAENRDKHIPTLRRYVEWSKNEAVFL